MVAFSWFYRLVDLSGKRPVFQYKQKWKSWDRKDRWNDNKDNDNKERSWGSREYYHQTREHSRDQRTDWAKRTRHDRHDSSSDRWKRSGRGGRSGRSPNSEVLPSSFAFFQGWSIRDFSSESFGPRLDVSPPFCWLGMVWELEQLPSLLSNILIGTRHKNVCSLKKSTTFFFGGGIWCFGWILVFRHHQPWLESFFFGQVLVNLAKNRDVPADVTRHGTPTIDVTSNSCKSLAEHTQGTWMQHSWNMVGHGGKELK